MATLEDADLSLKLSKQAGLEQLTELQQRLTALRLQYGGQLGSGELGPPLLLLFEGWDASGKGGAIRRVSAPLDPRHVTVAQSAAPSEREKAPPLSLAVFARAARLGRHVHL
jgi:AMP-polyphosphate phosphotransferase